MTKGRELKIAYIGGGSLGWARSMMVDLALEERMSGTVALYDINMEAARKNERLGNMISAHPDAKGKWTYTAVATIEEALANADFVIISILPGTLDDMETDVHLPEAYGIYQSVGDTVGPGGIMRAVRTIPMYASIAQQIKEHAPDAWVISYTNPMSLCVRTLYEVFPQIKAFGCCHEVFGTQQLLADMLADRLGIEVKERQEIHVNVLGINHFTWIDRASYQGLDLLPIYEQFVAKYREEGFEKSKDDWRTSVFHSAHRVKFDLFQRFGLIAAAGDRHLAEFLSFGYLKDPETVQRWKFHLTRVDFRKQMLQAKRMETENILSGADNVKISPSGEEGIQIMLALAGFGEMITNVNMPNQGQIQGFPQGAIVETNALVRRDSMQPIIAGQLPQDVHQLVMGHVANQEAVFQAVMMKDKEKLLQAFQQDPLVSSLSRNDAASLFSQMLGNLRPYLPEWDI
ncbi:family 4 glycosyl hydrolase [Brevibacillus migulae]|uniref:family 4 glycosyl hydrolase n=1 Tax=Brevibacillus migulae TaxID=1644114 RepID=UPI00106EBECB|nr:alpha-glucosidase/alpha-galactosidase [Brevibacillus migulae]